MKTLKTFLAIILVFAASLFSYAQTNMPKPDLPNVSYGEHERNVLDIWFADKNKQTPLAIYIHGGGFSTGSKEKMRPSTNTWMTVSIMMPLWRTFLISYVNVKNEHMQSIIS